MCGHDHVMAEYGMVRADMTLCHVVVLVHNLVMVVVLEQR